MKDNIILEKIRAYLISTNVDFENHELLRNIEDRKNGRVFTFSDNIKGLIYAQLSNQTKWINIVPKLAQIDKLFFYYNKDKIFSMPASYFYDGIFSLKCGNIATRKQMASLRDNIATLEKIENIYGSMDNFYNSYSAATIAKMLSGGKYKLKYIGYALAWEFLRNVGVDGAKPDLHMCRILSNNRLGYSNRDIATEDEVIKIIDRISANTGYSKALIDILLWSYCAEGYGAVCTASPKCNKCVIGEYCNGTIF